MSTKCKTCNDSKRVYVISYKRMKQPIVPVMEGTDPTPTSFTLEQTIVPCPDCDRTTYEPAP